MDNSIKNNLEQDILQLIKEKIQKREMTAAEAKQIAKEVIFLIDSQSSLTIIHKNLLKLEQEFPELENAIDPTLDDFNEKIINSVTLQLQTLLEQGKIDDAHRFTTLLIEESKNN